jgi:hypothetical protein
LRTYMLIAKKDFVSHINHKIWLKIWILHIAIELVDYDDDDDDL